MRQLDGAFLTTQLLVSIHAPWEGCDNTFRGAKQPYSEFQFTHPGKGATSISIPRYEEIDRFNSRTLGRVRRRPRGLQDVALRVSIHAPWEGCDTKLRHRNLRRLSFQFTHPGKGATYLLPSFHIRSAKVSIHAPWEGCDRGRNRLACNTGGFNSRTLGRVRLAVTFSTLACIICFNSRTLGRVRHAGCLGAFRGGGFNSRTLGRVRRHGWRYGRLNGRVSIHAPWEGCDALL